ncbi:MAG: divalent-cation tolerance protein CutA [Burkholderiales bacterium]|nr:divalent-cation tolerance protein CutA [Burkholderiales bacterium]
MQRTTVLPVDEVVLVLTSLPDRDAALRLAHGLVERRLAACVNVLGECTSVYRWRGAVETAREIPVLIKTRTALYREVEAAIGELHPYEVPEVIALSVTRGLPGYLQWVGESTTISIG